MPSSKDTVTGLDVGTDQISAIIGHKLEDGVIDIIGLGTAQSAGLRKGVVVDIEETITAVSSALSEAEKMAGVVPEKADVGIGGSHIESSNSKGVIAVSRADGEITEEDVDRVIEAARAVSVPANREIIHVIPRIFTVDGQSGIHDPVGMTGVRLEVETHVISGSTPVIKNLSKCIYQSGLDISELIFSPLASGSMLLTKQQKEVGAAVIDLGAGTTDLAVFEEGDILHSAVIPLGSLHITNDIAIGLRTSIDIAELIKRRYGNVDPEEKDDDQEIKFADIESSEEGDFSQKYVNDIISARLSEIFNHISEELNKVGRDGNLPAGAVFCGGGAKLNGLTAAAKEGLKLPAQVGKPAIKISGLMDKVNDPKFATAIGLMVWGVNLQGEQSHPSKLNVSSIASKAKGFFRNLLP